MGVDFALGDVAEARFDDVFDRVLEGDDVILSRDVHLVDEGGEGCGFA